MTRRELIARVAHQTGLSREQAQAAVQAALAAIAEAVSAGELVQLAGFGAFSRHERPAHQARNPRTGERVAVAASRTVRFRPGEGFKSLLNG